MKTEYTNAEKVSDRFLETKYAELREKLIPLKVTTKFDEKFKRIVDSDEDNYEKLKRLIHLDAEVEAYIKSKEFFFDIVNSVFSKSNTYPYSFIHDDVLQIISYIINLAWYFKDQRVNFPMHTETLYKLLDNEFLGSGNITVFEDIIMKQLTVEDWKKIYEIIENHYRELFTKVLTEDLAKLKEEYSQKISKTVDFNLDSRDSIYEVLIRFISDINLQVFWEHFDYPESDHFCVCFKELIQETVSQIQVYPKYTLNSSFWDLLISFDEFYRNRSSDDELLVEKQASEESKHYFNALDMKQAPENYEEMIASKKVLCNLDFTGLDLTDIEITNHTIVNCDFTDTNATINISSINSEQVLYFVCGKPFDRHNLVFSSFRGCNIVGANCDELNRFSFSSSTFDENVLEECGFECEDVEEELREKFYRRKILTTQELRMLMEKRIDVAKRYEFGGVETSSLIWLLNFKKVFPGRYYALRSFWKTN